MQTTAPPKAPPFCPHPACPFHKGDTRLWRYHRHGTYVGGAPRRASTQRYKCLHCGHCFSDRTFRTSYRLKRPELLRPIAARLVGCSGFRQIARELGVSPQTVARHAARLGRQAQLFHEGFRRRYRMDEPMALDSFVSFEWSQFYPTHYHVLVGRNSHYFVGFTDSEVRRSGRMTSRQKRRRRELEAAFGRPDPRSIEKEVAALLRCTVPAGKSIELTTDEHEDYPRALRRVRMLEIEHHTISSRAARNIQNPLFAVNLLDLLIRHSSANHKRETIAFSRRRLSAIERLWLFLVWRNYVKAFSERRGGGTPAQRAGVTMRRWKLRELFRRRIFPARVGLPMRWLNHFKGRVRTRALDATSKAPAGATIT